MGIQSKILSVVGAMIFIVILLTTILISQRAQTLSKDSSLQIAERTAQRYGLEVQQLLEGALGDARLLEATFWQLRNANVDRRLLDKILLENTRMNKNILGSWMMWEPNAYDSKDNEYINTEGHDNTGRVNSFWHWSGDDIVLENNIDWQTSGWYQNPKKYLKETLEDPYFYNVSGIEELLISSVSPIIHNNQFYGVVGVDLKLEIIQELVESLKVVDTGYSTLIANNGAYVAHPEKDRIGKYIKDFESNLSSIINVENSNGVIIETTFDDILQTLVYRLLVKIDIANVNSPWTLIVTIPVHKVLEPAIKIRNEIFITGLISGLTMLLLLTFLIRNLLAPILEMTHILKTKFDSKLSIFPQFNISSQDEIGELAASFNQMSLEVNQSKQQLETLNIELSIFNDQLEQRVLRKTKKLLESEKMASLGRLVTGVSHELNTPVGVCVTAISFLQEQLAPQSNSTAEDIQEGLALLSENINKVSSLINSLKLLSISSSAEEKTQFFCRELINTTASHVRSQFDASNVEIIIEGEEIEINSFPIALSQLLNHIISNAIIHGFKSENGLSKEGIVSITLQHTDDQISILCSDNGIGMNQEMKGRIFEAFSTLQLGTAGKGLGMNIVYNIVTRTLNGTIECESNNEGTQYLIRFPC